MALYTLATVLSCGFCRFVTPPLHVHEHVSLRHTVLDAAKLITYRRPTALFTKEQWRELSSMCEELGVSPRLLRRLYLVMCTFARANGERGGVVLNRLFKDLNLRFMGLTMLAYRLFPTYEEVEVIESKMGWTVPGTIVPDRNFVKLLHVRPLREPVKEFSLSDGFSMEQRHVSQVAKLPDRRVVVIKQFGVVDNNRSRPSYVGENTEPSAAALAERDSRYKERMEWNNRSGHTSKGSKAEWLRKHSGTKRQVVAFPKFARSMLRVCALNYPELMKYAATEISSAHYGSFSTHDVVRLVRVIQGDLDPKRRGSVKRLHELRTLEMLVRERLDKDARGQGIERWITFAFRYPALIYPLVHLQMLFRHRVFGEAYWHKHTGFARLASTHQRLRSRYNTRRRKMRDRLLAFRLRQTKTTVVEAEEPCSPHSPHSPLTPGTPEESTFGAKDDSDPFRALVGRRSEFARDPWLPPRSSREAWVSTAQNLMKRLLTKHSSRSVQRRSPNRRRRHVSNRSRGGCLYCRVDTLVQGSGFCSPCESEALSMLADAGGYRFARDMVEFARLATKDKFEIFHEGLEEVCWIAEKDPPSGKHFFFNVATGVSTWERPDAYDGPEIEEDELSLEPESDEDDEYYESDGEGSEEEFADGDSSNERQKQDYV